ncbi:MAG: hypothetical protein U1E53_17515 [Dongiaceae bacterium]
MASISVRTRSLARALATLVPLYAHAANAAALQPESCTAKFSSEAASVFQESSKKLLNTLHAETLLRLVAPPTPVDSLSTSAWLRQQLCPFDRNRMSHDATLALGTETQADAWITQANSFFQVYLLATSPTFYKLTADRLATFAGSAASGQSSIQDAIDLLALIETNAQNNTGKITQAGLTKLFGDMKITPGTGESNP